MPVQIDLFATAQHHQLPWYLSPRTEDPHALGHNVFAYHWPRDVLLYANPPWTILDQVVDKILMDRVRIMLVAPFWPEAQWYRKVRPFIVDRCLWKQALYLAPDGRLRPRPKWSTLFMSIDASLVVKSSTH